jgi:hypothetical protein
MKIAVLLHDAERDGDMAQDIASTLGNLGHEVLTPIDLYCESVSLGTPSELSLMLSREPVPLLHYLKAIAFGHNLAAPPIHTLALLDHPVHWRRVLERVGVPLGRYVLLDGSQDPRRDPLVSVLGFPLLALSMSLAPPRMSRQARDREELWDAVSDIRRTSEQVLLVREPSGLAVSWLTGIDTGGPILASRVGLDEPHRKLSMELVKHTNRFMELVGPCCIELVWERDQLSLNTISHVTDLSRNGDAFLATGDDYTSFMAGIVEQAFRTRK